MARGQKQKNLTYKVVYVDGITPEDDRFWVSEKHLEKAAVSILNMIDQLEVKGLMKSTKKTAS